MLFSEAWLRTLVDPKMKTEELARSLTMAGLEIEGTNLAAPFFSGVVVGHILAVEPHPNADKLRVCQVDKGNEVVQVVCGAPNARVGIKVPLATVGAVLPGNFMINKGNLRGVDSFGMLCSSQELGIDKEGSGLYELSEDAPVGADLRQYLDLDDTIFEIKLTPNRADCLSLRGIAREVRALTNSDLNLPKATPAPVTIDDVLPVKVLAPDLCGRFAGRIIKGVNAKAPTPTWLKQRLERSGMRSISILVDISNYIMLELGRPSHIFDLAKIKASNPNNGLVVRWAKSGEVVKLLNGQEVPLDSNFGVICTASADHNHETVECLAGIMGGDHTAVSLDTQDIFIETAFWHPNAIAGRTRQLKLNSDAAYRFERGVDFNGIDHDLERISNLILELCSGQAGPVQDEIINLPQRKVVPMRLSRCQKILGIPLTKQIVAAVFNQLGFEFKESGVDTDTTDTADTADTTDTIFHVTAPSYRFDIEIEADLIEEIARIYGFDHIPEKPPVVPAIMHANLEAKPTLHRLRQLIAQQDYQEVINFSFVAREWEEQYQNTAKPIKLLNPIASNLEVMRTSLIAGLVDNIVYNSKHQQSRVRVFEIGRVFLEDANQAPNDLEVLGIRQPIKAAGAAWGGRYPEQWSGKTQNVDFFDVKNDVLQLFGACQERLSFVAQTFPSCHPGRSAAIYFDNQPIGMIGELHPKLVQQLGLIHAPVVFEFDAQVWQNQSQPLPVVRKIAKQPVVQRDLAIWVDSNVSVQSIIDTLNQAKNLQPESNELSILQNIQLFDLWKKDESATQKSLAFHFMLQDEEQTLTDTQVEQCMARILQILQTSHQASLR